MRFTASAGKGRQSHAVLGHVRAEEKREGVLLCVLTGADYCAPSSWSLQQRTGPPHTGPLGPLEVSPRTSRRPQ